MKVAVFLIHAWMLMCPAFANRVCLQCRHPNADEDRYCEECAAELRPWTPQDRKEVPKPAPIEASVPMPSKNPDPVRSKEPLPRDFKPPLFCIRGMQVELGMSKSSLRNRLDPDTFGDTWHFNSGPQQSELHFENGILQSWDWRLEARENWDFSRDLMENARRLKMGMSEAEVKQLLGPPHIEEESCSLVSYSLKWTYYLKAEDLLKQWSQVPGEELNPYSAVPADQEITPAVALSFDDTFHVIDLVFADVSLSREATPGFVHESR